MQSSSDQHHADHDNAPPGELWNHRLLTDPHGQRDKAERVRVMFDAIAPTYELVNRLTSFGRDAAWRREAVALAGPTRSDRVLDVACGTGDLARAFAGRAGAVVGLDFAEKMLALAAARTEDHAAGARLTWCRADAMRLPFADEAFNMTSCAFGVRNFQDLNAGLAEMRRVLAPAGRAIIVEFAMPHRRAMRWLYGLYFRHVLPRLANIISRDRTGAYRYLTHSVEAFVDPDEMVRRLGRAGFAEVRAHGLTAGVVVVYVAETGR